MISVEYYLAPGYGRLLARGPSGQKLTREARKIAFAHLVEIDAPCCHPRLLRWRLRKLELWEKDAYPMIELFCGHYKAWRSALASYLQADADVAKRELIRIFYGGNPSVDIPWLRKLGDEVQRAARAILNHTSSSRWSDMYESRANPEFSRMSAILSFDEASLLDLFYKQAGLEMQVALFDGGYLQCNSMAEDARLRYCLCKAAEDVIPMEIKSPAPPDLQGITRLLVRHSGVGVSPCSHVRFDNCLLSALHSVSPELDFSMLQDQIQATPGTGLSANDFNIAAMCGSQRAEPILQLRLAQTAGLLDTINGNTDPVLCHEWISSEQGHWWSFVPQHSSVEVHDCLADGFLITADMSTFKEMVSSTSALTFFILVRVGQSAVLPQGEEYHLRGNATPRITTPLATCSICSAPLMDAETVEAIIYGLEGATQVQHLRRRCTRRSCYVRHSYNYVQTGHCKLNTLHPDQADYILVTTQTGFAKQFLHYHDLLHFRGYLSMSALAWAQQEIKLHGEHTQASWLQSYASARLLYNAMVEFAQVWQALPEEQLLRKLRGINVETPLSPSLMKEYRLWFLRSVLSTRKKKTVTAICMDGHEKIAVKCSGIPPSRGGRPRNEGKVRPFNNGWFMVCSPQTGLILSVMEMIEPEDNQLALSAVQELKEHYPNLNLVIYDRACKVMKAGRKTAGLESIKHWAVDKFHAKGHVDDCPCHPENIRALKRQLKGLNTSLSEQIFSWFRGYANTFNAMSPLTHHFYVILYSRRHNDLVRQNDTSHLNSYAAPKKVAQNKKLMKRPASRPYACKRPASSSRGSSRGLKRPSTST